MDEVKSIRIRKRLYTEGENTGSADIKVTLYRKRSKRSCKGFSLNESGDENFEVWKESRYEGDRYENLSDDAIIDDFIRVNTLQERPQGDKITIGFEPRKQVTYYEKIQDPFTKQVPVRRSFGFDPYYLNNGSAVYIKWFKTATSVVEWNFFDATTATMSASGSVYLRIETNETSKPDIYFYYTKTTPPFNGTTPSFFDVESIWENAVYGLNPIAGMSANGQQYLLPGETFIDSSEFIPQGGTEYGTQIYENGVYMGVSENPELVSPLFVRRVEIYPPGDAKGDYIDKPFAVESSSSNTSNNYVFRYLSDISSNASLDYKYFVDNMGIDALSSGKTYSYMRDWVLLADLIEAWKKAIPDYKDLSTCGPDYIQCNKIKYISPVKPLQEALIEAAGVTPSNLQPTLPGTPTGLSGPSQSLLNFLFPEEFEIVERQDVPEFKIFVGDIPSQEIEGAFIFSDEGDTEQLADEEYLELGYQGDEEDIGSDVADEPIDWINQPDPNLPPSTETPTATSADGTIVNVESSPVGYGPNGGKLVKKSGSNFYIVDSSKGLAGHRLQNIWTDLSKHLQANGYAGAKVFSNGIMRDLKASTYPGSPARVAGSLHGAGLAVDCQFSIPGFKWKGIGDNGNLAKDPKLTKIIAAWTKSQGDLIWGASFNKSKPDEGIVTGRGITEYHHWELKKSEIAKYWKPFKSELEKFGLSYDNLDGPSKLEVAYKKFMNSVGVTS